MSEYLDFKTLVTRVPYCRKTIERMMARKVLLEGVHYRRPTGEHGKVLFFWSAVEACLKGKDHRLRIDHASQKQARHPVS